MGRGRGGAGRPGRSAAIAGFTPEQSTAIRGVIGRVQSGEVSRKTLRSELSQARQELASADKSVTAVRRSVGTNVEDRIAARRIDSAESARSYAANYARSAFRPQPPAIVGRLESAYARRDRAQTRVNAYEYVLANTGK